MQVFLRSKFLNKFSIFAGSLPVFLLSGSDMSKILLTTLTQTHPSSLPHQCHAFPTMETLPEELGNASATYAGTAGWQQGWDLPQTQGIAICVFFPLQIKGFFPCVLAPTGFYIYLSLF